MTKEDKEIRAIKKLITGKTVKQLIKEVCGKKLGYGLYRTVYELKDFPAYVIKFERDMTTADFANVTEWRNYINNKDWEQFSKWLAPCHLINETGNILIQSRVEHRDKSLYPKKLPALFMDIKYKNFGWIGKQFVCCDYPWLVQCDYRLKRVKYWNP